MDILSILLSLGNIAVACVNIRAIKRLKSIDYTKIFNGAKFQNPGEKEREKGKEISAFDWQFLSNILLIILNLVFIIGVISNRVLTTLAIQKM
ncbi:MAG: hypothetical protein PHS93_09845 [Candidatus Omnitrophica bacterium]|nr:hypothetical protein [Candidatus Omnitrophota bacterium]MDD5353451.1 hypothetical protein [Candidatus Omnitrophota bacterium]MDD5551451.1 hypothetical protein [Candidatus Omnitrophota bacterium]